MVDLINSLKGIMDFAWQILSIPIPLAKGFNITLWEVLIFILLGSILWRFVEGVFLDKE